MKRTIAILVGVVSVGISAYLASHLWAQPAAAPAAPSASAYVPCTSKIAVINLQKVIKNYLKFKNMQMEMKKEAEGYAAQIEGYKAKAKQLQTQGEQATTAEQREKIAKDIKDLNYQAQSKSEEFDAALQKHQFEQMVVTYKDIEKAVEAFAKARGLELVMHYQDGEGPEMFIPQFFSRRMSSGACQPIYMAGGPAGGMDITLSITEMLNKGMNPGSAAAPAGAAPVR